MAGGEFLMRIYPAELLNRGKQVVTRFRNKSRIPRIKRAGRRSGQAKRVQAMLRRIGL